MTSLLNIYQDKIAAGTLTADPDQKRAIVALDQVAQEARAAIENKARLGAKIGALFGGASHNAKGLYLWGGVGRGKSMVMDLFYQTVKDDFKATRIHFHEFMIQTHNDLHRRRSEGDKGNEAAIMMYAREIAAKTDILCFDEFHVTDIADAMILMRLFSAFFESGITVVTTSNWPPARLYEGGLQRERFLPFIDLLQNHMNICEMNGAVDYRLKYLSESGVYFYPLGHASETQTKQLFDKLTDGTKPYSESLSVKKRALKVSKTAKGVAWFSFAELCEKPLGAEDYLAIAKAYHTVFVVDVPKLKYDRRNETKRMMTMIDNFYEQKTKLVISAEAAVDKLYFSGDYEFEFERTVSRLVEMQGKEYLQ